MSSPPDDAFAVVYLEYYGELRRFVRRRARPLNVDDIVSETFTIAWVRRASLPHPALPWLYNTARNVMLNASRGAGRQRALAVRLASVTPDTGPDDVDTLERRLDVRAAFVTLRAVDQEVLALDAWEDLDSRSAARVLGCTRASYSMRLTRARRRLAALLAEPVASPSGRDAPSPPPASPSTPLELSR